MNFTHEFTNLRNTQHDIIVRIAKNHLNGSRFDKKLVSDIDKTINKFYALLDELVEKEQKIQMSLYNECELYNNDLVNEYEKI